MNSGAATIGDSALTGNYGVARTVTNIAISDIPPQEYWPKYAARFTGEELKDMMHWHALPQGWQEMDYQSFLAARRPMIAQVIKQGYQRLVGAEA